MIIKEYGEIRVNLKRELDARNMTRNQLARAIDARFEVIDKWCKGYVKKIDADVLARICFVLKCEVKDIVEYCEISESNQNDKTDEERIL